MKSVQRIVSADLSFLLRRPCRACLHHEGTRQIRISPKLFVLSMSATSTQSKWGLSRLLIRYVDSLLPETARLGICIASVRCRDTTLHLVVQHNNAYTPIAFVAGLRLCNSKTPQLCRLN